MSQQQKNLEAALRERIAELEAKLDKAEERGNALSRLHMEAEAHVDKLEAAEKQDDETICKLERTISDLHNDIASVIYVRDKQDQRIKELGRLAVLNNILSRDDNEKQIRIEALSRRIAELEAELKDLEERHALNLGIIEANEQRIKELEEKPSPLEKAAVLVASSVFQWGDTVARLEYLEAQHKTMAALIEEQKAEIERLKNP